jgi:hypothetical protein
MRHLFADFARLGERPGLGLSIPLGRVDRSPELAKLTDGEHVLLVEPGNLYAEGVAQTHVEGDDRWWYGVIESRAAIHTLAPDQATPDEPEE